MHSLTRSKEFAAKHPDFNESLLRAHEEGHTLSDEAVEHLKRIDRLDVAYFASKKENLSWRDKFHNLTSKPKEQIAELDRIAGRLDRDGTFADTNSVLSEVDQHLQRRREERRRGLRQR